MIRFHLLGTLKLHKEVPVYWAMIKIRKDNVPVDWHAIFLV